MARPKNPVYARKLVQARAARPHGRPSSTLPWQFYLTFETSDGLSTLHHREIRAIIEGSELASQIEAIPASAYRDTEDFKAAMRVIELLRSKEFNEKAA
jgi:hypothetical protein